MAQGSNRVSSGLVTASFAAVLAVYVAGYSRTQSAADKFASQVAARRPAVTLPGPASVQAGLHPGLHQHDSHVEHSREEARVRKSLAVRPNPVIHAEPVKPSATPTPEPVAVEPVPTPTPIPEPIAPEPKVEAVAAAKVETPVWKDGTYSGWGYSRHGDIEAEVVIAGGRILSAVISQCRTRYSCSVIEKLPPQVAVRQSPDVDYVSGATQSADAFYGAVVAALGKAK